MSDFYINCIQFPLFENFHLSLWTFVTLCYCILCTLFCCFLNISNIFFSIYSLLYLIGAFLLNCGINQSLFQHRIEMTKSIRQCNIMLEALCLPLPPPLQRHSRHLLTSASVFMQRCTFLCCWFHQFPFIQPTKTNFSMYVECCIVCFICWSYYYDYL